MYVMIMTILVVVVVVAAIIIMWSNSTTNDGSIQFNTELRIVQEVMTQDVHLHRLLMIEILNNKPHPPLQNSSKNTPEDETKDLHASVEGIKAADRAIGGDSVTFNEMMVGMSLLGKSLVRSLGNVIAQRIAVLMQNRNAILRDYYQSMHRVICQNGICLQVTEIPINEGGEHGEYDEDEYNEDGDTIVIQQIKQIKSKDMVRSDDRVKSNDKMKDRVRSNDKMQDRTKERSDNRGKDGPKSVDSFLETGATATPSTVRKVVHPLFPDQADQARTMEIKSFIPNAGFDKQTSDITSTTIQKLEILDHEITDTIAAAFHVRDVDSKPNSSKRPILHHERLFNLLSMYDKELIHQSKLYVSQQYSRSMNCAQSSYELANHISQEWHTIMKESQAVMNTSHRLFDFVII